MRLCCKKAVHIVDCTLRYRSVSTVPEIEREKATKDESSSATARFSPEAAMLKEDFFDLQSQLPRSCRLIAQINYFDALKLSKLTKYPLTVISVAALRQVAVQLGLPLEKVQKFSFAVEQKMNDNCYHNAIHVSDVVQSTYIQTLTAGPICDICQDPIVKLSVILAAIVHDVGHPGYNNAFLVASRHSIARKHGDLAPAEHMHFEIFQKLIQQPELNFLECLTSEQHTSVIALVKHAVLATDMSNHLEFVYRLEPIDSEKYVLFKLAFALKVADMSHSMRSFSVHNKFVDMLKEEFRKQGDRERELRLQVTSGMYE
uniref:3',5'-cyclic-nucleotide phosphodiesterase n=1 Tax=Tetraselmis sp. GSL018 TaxID=582737 RepID=A0A061QR10_9CHLO